MATDSAPPSELTTPPVSRLLNYQEARQEYKQWFTNYIPSKEGKLKGLYPDYQEGSYVVFEYPEDVADQRAIVLNFIEPGRALAAAIMPAADVAETGQTQLKAPKGSDLSVRIQYTKHTNVGTTKVDKDLVMVPNAGGFVKVDEFMQMPPQMIDEQYQSLFTVLKVETIKGTRTRKILGYVPKGFLCVVGWGDLKAKRPPPRPA